MNLAVSLGVHPQNSKTSKALSVDSRNVVRSSAVDKDLRGISSGKSDIRYLTDDNMLLGIILIVTTVSEEVTTVEDCACSGNSLPLQEQILPLQL